MRCTSTYGYSLPHPPSKHQRQSRRTTTLSSPGRSGSYEVPEANMRPGSAAANGSALLGGELRARVRLQESARRTAKDPHRNALVRRSFPDLPEQPADLLRRPLDPGADDPVGALSPAGEALHHLAVALGAPIR